MLVFQLLKSGCVKSVLGPYMYLRVSYIAVLYYWWKPLWLMISLYGANYGSSDNSAGKKESLMLTFKSESCILKILQTWCKLDLGILLTIFREYSDLRLVYQKITLSWQHWNFIVIKCQQDLDWLIKISSTSMFITSQIKNREVYT